MLDLDNLKRSERKKLSTVTHKILDKVLCEKTKEVFIRNIRTWKLKIFGVSASLIASGWTEEDSPHATKNYFLIVRKDHRIVLDVIFEASPGGSEIICQVNKYIPGDWEQRVMHVT